VTTEYRAGDEDIYITVAARPDGNVSLGIHLTANGERIYGIVLPPETARNAAQKLTLASWKAEELKQWIEGQADG
jgi:hypothetical protein